MLIYPFCPEVTTYRRRIYFVTMDEIQQGDESNINIVITTDGQEPPQVCMKMRKMTMNQERNPKCSDSNVYWGDANPKQQTIGFEKSPKSPIDEELSRRTFQPVADTPGVSSGKDLDEPQRREVADRNLDNLEGRNVENGDDVSYDPKKELNSITMKLFKVATDSKESNDDDLSNTDHKSPSAYMSDSSLAGSLIGDDSRDYLSKPSNDLDDDGGTDTDEEKKQEEYKGGRYLPRHDVFIPSSNENIESSFSPDKHQSLLFGNLDQSFENNIPSVFDNITVCSAEEMRDIVKMCFSAMAIVFSSHNPSVTTITRSGGMNAENLKETFIDEDVLKNEDVIVQKVEGFNGADSSSRSIVDTNLKRKHIFSAKATPSPTMSSLVSCISDDNNDSIYSNENGGSTIDDTILNETSSTPTMVDNMEPIQRPSVPLAVVRMLWKQLLKYRLYDRPRQQVEKDRNDIENYSKLSSERAGILGIGHFDFYNACRLYIIKRHL